MNIYKNLMFLQGHFVDPHMDDAYEQAPAPQRDPAPPAGDKAGRAWWARWSWFGTAQPVDPGRPDACCQC